MQVGLYQSVSGLKALAAYEDNVASNLARASVVGGRSVSTAFELKPQQSSQTKGIFSLNQPLGVKDLPISTTTVVNFSQGGIQTTGRETDFAIHGDAFFAVQEPGTDGGTAVRYTRDGQFTVDSTGTLIAPDGAKLLLDNGNPLTIPATAKDKTLHVLSDGTIYIGDNKQPEGKLMTAHFEEPRQSLTMTSTGRFTIADPKDEKNKKLDGLATDDHIIQGALEGLNSTAINDMATMITIQRSYEANQKAILTQDDVNGKMIDAMTQSS